MTVEAGLGGAHRLDVEPRHTGAANGFSGFAVLSGFAVRLDLIRLARFRSGAR